MNNLAYYRRVLVSLGLIATLATFSIFTLQGEAQQTRAGDGAGVNYLKQRRISESDKYLGADSETPARANAATDEEASMAPQANPLIYLYDFQTDRIATIRANAPQDILSEVALTGLDTANGEYLTGIDFRPADGMLYAVAQIEQCPPPGPCNSRVVRINPTTGAVTSVAPPPGVFFPFPSGIFVGLDFNPVVDLIRFVTADNDNRRYNPTTGARADVPVNDLPLAYATGDAGAGVDPAVAHVAYTNSFVGATSTTLYGIDVARDVLVTINPPNNGTLNTVGPLGVNAGGFGGFDIQQGTNLAYAVLSVGPPGAALSTLYSINLTTGAATFIDVIGPINFQDPRVDGVAIAFDPAGGAADLSITKTNNRTTYVPGGQTTYTIVASNTGPDPVANAVVTDTFSSQFSGTPSFTCTGSGGGTCPASGTGNISAPVNLPSGGSVTFTVTGTVAATATGNVTNTASIATPLGVTDATPGNNSATDTDTVGGTVDLSITKTNNRTSYTPGGGATTYTITATNAGPDPVNNAVVTDTFSSQFSGTPSFTCTGSGGGTCPANGTGNINSSVNLPSGGSVTFTVSATVAAGATGNVTNTASIAAPTGVTDSNPGNNSATDTDTAAVPAVGDLSITKTNNRSNYFAGGPTTYTIVASNSGPGAVTGATVTDTFSSQFSGTPSFTCTGAGGGTCPASGTGNINAPVSIPAGGSVRFTVTATVAANATGNVANTASIAAPAGFTDSTPGNNSATDTDTVTPTAAEVEVTGRVLSPDGRGMGNTRITITDAGGNTRSVVTNSFGYYTFTQVEAGNTYVIAPITRRYKFSPRAIEVADSVSGFDFVGREE